MLAEKGGNNPELERLTVNLVVNLSNAWMSKCDDTDRPSWISVNRGRSTVLREIDHLTKILEEV